MDNLALLAHFALKKKIISLVFFYEKNMSGFIVYYGNNTNKTEELLIWKKNLELKNPPGNN